MNEIRSNLEANRIFSAWRKHRWDSANLNRDSSLRFFASSAKAPRHARICRYLQTVGEQYRLCGGEGRIRTLGTLWQSSGRIVPNIGALFSSKIKQQCCRDILRQ